MGVVDTLAVLVALAVLVLVGVLVAPSSRKIIRGLEHQPVLLKDCVDEVGVAPAPPNGLEQALRKRHTRKRPAGMERPG
jgi:hypothetical protein